jgi:hypothetical protein
LQVPNRLTFQIAYHLDLEDMNLNRAEAVAASRPLLKLQKRTNESGQLTPTAVNEIREFCRQHLATPPASAPAVAGATD